MTCGQAADAPAPQPAQPSNTGFSGDSALTVDFNNFEPNAPKEKNSRPAKVIAITLLSLVAVIAFVVVASGIENSKYIKAETNPELSASLSPSKIEQIALEHCDALAGALPTDATVKALNQRAAALTKYGAGTARKAQKLLNASKWVYSTEIKDIDAALAGVTVGALDEVIAKTDTIREDDRGVFADLWAAPFLTQALETCDLNARVDAARSAQASFTSAKSSLETYAASVPWYPDGYNEWSGDSNVAWKWANGLDCNLGDWCWHIKLIAQSGCPGGVYAELNILDSGDNVIDYTNDTVASLGAMQTAVMEFSTYNDRVSSGQMIKISCHSY